ncbi:MAG: hypothetical protein JXA49_04055 [Actinobacteria bacterium]|nr:hypothetical protein [Actinomycetota bacterium]
MARYLEITDKLREEAASKQKAAMKKNGLKPGVVEAWEDGYRTAGMDVSFEWWYFDFQLDDGSACVVVFYTKPGMTPKNPLKPSVLMIYRTPEGETRRDTAFFEPEQFSSSKESCDVKVGPNRVSGNLDSYQVHAEVAGITCDLSIERKAPSWRPGSGVRYIDKAQTKFFAWVVPVSYGLVKGKLIVDGNEREVKGTAYHDHNWGNLMVAGMLDHWYWGRGHVGDYTFIFAQMVTNGILGRGAIKLPVFFLAKGSEVIIEDALPFRLEPSRFVDGPSDRKHPMRLDLSWVSDEGRVSIDITNPKMIEELNIRRDDKEGPLFRRLVTRIIENTHYCDFEADAEVKVNIKGIDETVKGNVIFEQMLFHRKQHR